MNNPEKTWIKASPGDMPVHFNHLNELNDKQKSDFVYNILLIHYDRKSTVFSGVGYKEHGDKCYRSIDIPLLFDNDEEKEKIISFINANYNF